MEGKTTEAKIQAIQDYLYQLLEQLRHTLNNINPDNFNEAEVNGWAGETITKPIHAEIVDTANGLITYIDATAAGITVNVQKEYAAEWTVGTTYYLNDFVKVTTNSDQTETVNFYKCIYLGDGGQGHVAADTNKPGSGTAWQTYWVQVAAADVAYSRFDITADAIRSEVSRAKGAELSLTTSITQTADEIRLEASRVYAPLWDSNATYYKNNVVRTESGTPVMVKYWQCTADSTTQNPLDVSQTDWVQISAPAANSQIVQSADEIKAQVTDDQGNYTVLNLKSDGLHVGNAQGTTTIDGSSITTGTVTANEIDANYVYAGEISADQITAGTLTASNVELMGSFTAKAEGGGGEYDCGTIGGVVYLSGGQYIPLIEFASEDGNHFVEIGNAEVRLQSRNANTDRSVELVIGPDEITITKRTPSPKTYSLLALLDQI